MIQFVTKQDADYLDFLSKLREDRFSLFTKCPTLLAQKMSAIFEQSVRLLAQSSDKLIIKKTINNRPIGFNEIDFLIESTDKWVIGEVKSTISAKSPKGRLLQQQARVLKFIGDAPTKPIQTCGIIVNLYEDSPDVEAIDFNEPIVYVNAASLLNFALKNQLCDDPDFLQKAIDEDKTEPHKEGGKLSFGVGEPTTLGDLFKFE